MAKELALEMYADMHVGLRVISALLFCGIVLKLQGTNKVYQNPKVS
jgi:hypothetical protein